MADVRLSESPKPETGRVEPKFWHAEGDAAFGAPWQAQIFSMTVALNEAGLFTWKEWADVFSVHRRKSQEAGKPDTSQTYYEDWLDALEVMAAKQTLASREDQIRYREAWRGAAARTRHGEPIELQEADFKPAGRHLS